MTMRPNIKKTGKTNQTRKTKTSEKSEGINYISQKKRKSMYIWRITVIVCI